MNLVVFLTKKRGDRKMWWKRRWWISILEFFVFSFQASDFRHCGLRDQGSPDAAFPSLWLCEVGGTIFSSLLPGGGGGRGRRSGEAATQERRPACSTDRTAFPVAPSRAWSSLCASLVFGVTVRNDAISRTQSPWPSKFTTIEPKNGCGREAKMLLQACSL